MNIRLVRQSDIAFRTELDARWAVFFDTLGVDYQYEPTKFEKVGADYTPTFFLPESKTWVEVSPFDEALVGKATTIQGFLEGPSPMPHIDYLRETPDEECRGLLLLGEIPEPGVGMVLHNLIQMGPFDVDEPENCVGEEPTLCAFSSNALGLSKPGVRSVPIGFLDFMWAYFEHGDSCWSVKPTYIEMGYVDGGVDAALTAARVAKLNLASKK